MIRKGLATGICIAVMLLTAGCGSQEAGAGTADLAGYTAETGEAVEDTAAPGPEAARETEESAETERAGEAEDGGADSDLGNDELEGYVTRVDTGNKTVVISKIYKETDPDGGETGIAYVGGGGADEEPVNVYFRDDAVYTLKSIRDGGADVTTKEADFSDIQEGDILTVKGKEAVSEASGDEFLSCEVTISRVE